MNKEQIDDYERLRMEGMRNSLGPRDAHLADQAGCAAPEPSAETDAPSRSDTMLGFVILAFLAFIAGFFLGVWAKGMQ